MSASGANWPGPRLGIDLGGTTMTAVVTGAGASLRAEAHGETGDHADPGAVLDRVAALAREAMAAAGVSRGELVGAGIGLPGEVEPDRGLFRSSPILPTWRDVSVARLLGQRLGFAVGTENDANATLLGEWAFGAAGGADPVLLLTLGTGIGGAVLVDGRILRGHRGSAGEIGHLSIDPRGPRCWCGNHGCLGLLASTTALVETYRREAGLASADGLAVAEAWHLGDDAAATALDQMCDALAAGIAAAAVVLAPQRVVLFGGVLGGLGDPLLAGVRERLAGRPYPAVLAELEIVAATLGPLAGAVGASLLPVPSEDSGLASEDIL